MSNKQQRSQCRYCYNSRLEPSPSIVHWPSQFEHMVCSLSIILFFLNYASRKFLRRKTTPEFSVRFSFKPRTDSVVIFYLFLVVLCAILIFHFLLESHVTLLFLSFSAVKLRRARSRVTNIPVLCGAIGSFLRKNQDGKLIRYKALRHSWESFSPSRTSQKLKGNNGL